MDPAQNKKLLLYHTTVQFQQKVTVLIVNGISMNMSYVAKRLDFICASLLWRPFFRRGP